MRLDALRGFCGRQRSTMARRIGTAVSGTACLRLKSSSISWSAPSLGRRGRAQEDFAKLLTLIRRTEARYPQKFVKGWFVTLYEPTADQRGVFSRSKNRVVCVSWDQFRSKLVDARSYLALRTNYPFGSVRDPESGAARHSYRIHTD